MGEYLCFVFKRPREKVTYTSIVKSSQMTKIATTKFQTEVMYFFCLMCRFFGCTLSELLDILKDDVICENLEFLATKRAQAFTRRFFGWAIKNGHMYGTTTPDTEDDLVKAQSVLEMYETSHTSTSWTYNREVLRKFCKMCNISKCSIKQMQNILLRETIIQNAIKVLITERARSFTESFFPEALSQGWLVATSVPRWLVPPSVPKTRMIPGPVLNAMEHYNKLQ